jgi:hypothetical protein
MTTPDDSRPSVNANGVLGRLDDLDLDTIETLEDRVGYGIEDFLEVARDRDDAEKARRAWIEGGKVGPRPKAPPVGKLSRGLAFIALRLEDPSATWEAAGRVRLVDLFDSGAADALDAEAEATPVEVPPTAAAD